MNTMALTEVQRALFTKLSGDGVLMAMISGIYDVVPQKTELPYVVIGDGQSRMLDADAVNLTEMLLQLDVWTDATGRKAALTIMSRLFALLHLGSLTINGFQQVLLRCEQADTAIEEQATRIHGTLTVRVIAAEV
jgi:hypothetical protein